jgi:hypothetical protein
MLGHHQSERAIVGPSLQREEHVDHDPVPRHVRRPSSGTGPVVPAHGIRARRAPKAVPSTRERREPNGRRRRNHHSPTTGTIPDGVLSAYRPCPERERRGRPRPRLT